MIKLLKKLIQIENTSDDIDANKSALDFCQQYLAEKGIRSEIVWHANRPSLEWGAAPSETTFLFNTHIDVVPGPKKVFTPREVGDKLFGRGAADTKAMVAVFLSLSAEVVALATERGVHFSIVSDEEIGGSVTKEMLVHMPHVQFALFGEPTQLKLNNEAKGIMQIKITAKGKNAHGSKPWLGDNAILVLLGELEEFLVHNPLPSEYTWDTTFNFSQIQGGTAINQVPSTCEMWCDVRFTPNESREEIIANIKKYFSTSTVEIVRNESHIYTAPDNAHVMKLASVLKEFGVVPEFAKELGSSDARHCTQLDIPTIVFGPIGGSLHEDGEWVDVQSIETAKDIITTFVSSL